MSEPNASPNPVQPPSPPTPAPTPTPPTPTPSPTPEPAKTEALTLEAIKVPEGVELDKATAEQLLGVFNDEKLDSKARVQSLFDLHNKLMADAQVKAQENWNAIMTKWTEEAKADPVIGGDKLQPALGAISKLIDKYSVTAAGKSDPEMATKLRELSDTTGVGNHPAMVRFLYGIAKELALEGGPVPATTPPSGQLSAAQRLYPTLPPA